MLYLSREYSVRKKLAGKSEIVTLVLLGRRVIKSEDQTQYLRPSDTVLMAIVS